MDYWDGTRWTDEPRPEARPRSRAGRRLLGASTEAALITLLMFGLIAGTTLAARGGGKPGPTSTSPVLALVPLESTDGIAYYGQDITFEVYTSAAEPHVNVRCWQDGAFVYDGWRGFYDTAWFGRVFTLTSDTWASGGADCVARLVSWGRNGRERVLGELLFGVGA